MPHPPYPLSPTTILPIHTEKGCIHWYDFASLFTGGIQKVRPCVIIGRTNPRFTRIIISPISDIDHYLEHGQLKYPHHSALYKNTYPFLDKDSAVLLDQVYTIEKAEL